MFERSYQEPSKKSKSKIQFDLLHFKWGYLVVETELKFHEWLSTLERINIGETTFTPGQLSVWLMLIGRQVQQCKADSRIYIPIDLQHASILQLHFKKKQSDEMEAKLEASRVLLIGLMSSFDSPESDWQLSRTISHEIKEDKNGLWVANLEVLPNLEVAQFVFYGHVNSMTWIKEGWLLKGNTEIGHFHEPFESVTLEKQLWSLPVPRSPVFTFTFSNYLCNDSNDSMLHTTDEPITLKLQLDPQYMPEDPKLETWYVAKKIK